MKEKPFIASDKLGVEAIQWLQAQAGIKESKKKALVSWQQMLPGQQQVTMQTYEDLSGKKNLLWKRSIRPTKSEVMSHAKSHPHPGAVPQRRR